MKKLYQIIILSIFSGLSFSFFNLSPEDLLQTETTKTTDEHYIQKLFFNVEKTQNEKDIFPLQIDFDYSNILIGNKAIIGWGINCLFPYCIPSPEKTKCQYKGLKFDCQAANLTLGINTISESPKTGQLQTISVFFIIDIKCADSMNKMGVLGIHPKSSFLKTNDKNSLTFNVFAPNPNSTDLSLRIFYNHEYSFGIFKQESLDNKWQITEGVLKTENKNDKVLKQTFLNFSSNSFLNFAGADKFCQDQIKNVCKNIPDCDSSKSDFSLGFSLTFTGKNGQQFIILPKDYLSFNFEKNSFDCFLIDLKKSNYIEFGLRLFQKFPFSIEFVNDERVFVLQTEFEFKPVMSQNQIYIIVGLSIGIFLCIVGIFIVDRQHSKFKAK